VPWGFSLTTSSSFLTMTTGEPFGEQLLTVLGKDGGISDTDRTWVQGATGALGQGGRTKVMQETAEANSPDSCETQFRGRSPVPWTVPSSVDVPIRVWSRFPTEVLG